MFLLRNCFVALIDELTKAICLLFLPLNMSFIETILTFLILFGINLGTFIIFRGFPCNNTYFVQNQYIQSYKFSFHYIGKNKLSSKLFSSYADSCFFSFPKTVLALTLTVSSKYAKAVSIYLQPLITVGSYLLINVCTFFCKIE